MDNDSEFMDRTVDRAVPPPKEVHTTPVTLYRRNGSYLKTIQVPAPVDPADVFSDHPEVHQVQLDAVGLYFSRRQFKKFDNEKGTVSG